MNHSYDLDTPLIDFTGSKGLSSWTIRNAVESLGIYGSTGSGKTSGSSRLVATKFLSHAFGGLVLCAKNEEVNLWKEYCALTNRTDDLIIVGPGGGNYFNFMEYESTSKDGNSIITENLVHVLKTVIQASEEKNSDKSDDPFWQNALDLLISNVTDLCVLAYGKVSIQNMYDVVMTAPKGPDNNLSQSSAEEDKNSAFRKAFGLARKNIIAQIDAWRESLSDEEKLSLMEDEVYNAALYDAVPGARVLQFVDQFFIETYRSLSEKTKSIILLSFSSFLFRLLREPVYSIFCRRASTFTPEDCLEGKIIVLNFPVKKYHKVGRIYR